MAVMAAAVLLSGCRSLGVPAGASVTIEQPRVEYGWRSVASPADVARIEGLDAVWRTAFAAGRPSTVTDPDAALPRAALPPGTYHCRSHRVGAPAPRRGRAATVQRPFLCFAVVQNDLIAFTQQSGTSRPGGFVYTDGDRRMIFIGAEATTGERTVPAYGARADRDLIGVIQRIGPFRYRVVLAPRAAGEAIDVLELTPLL